jgi:hypothetical protein
LTQAELAGRIGVARETISRCETGRAVHPAMVRGIADALLLAPSVLIGSTDLDAPADAYRTCRRCGARRPQHGFLREKGPSTCICVSRICRTRRETLTDGRAHSSEVARLRSLQPTTRPAGPMCAGGCHLEEMSVADRLTDAPRPCAEPAFRGRRIAGLLE